MRKEFSLSDDAMLNDFACECDGYFSSLCDVTEIGARLSENEDGSSAVFVNR